MAIQLIFFIIFMAWVVAFFALSLQDNYFMILAGLFMTIIGISVLSTGIGATKDFITNGFGILHLGIGFYLIIKPAIALISEGMD